MQHIISGVAGVVVATTITAIFFLCEPVQAAGSASSVPYPSHLSLADAEGLWLVHNREVKIARAALEGAEADVVSAGQRPNPQLSVNVSTLSTNPGVGNGGLRDKMMDTVVGLSQIFERGGKRELRSEAARRRADAAKGDYADTQRSQRMVLFQAYYDLLLAQEKQRIAEDTAALYRKTLAAADLRFKAGDLSGGETARIRVEAYRAENDARQAAGDLARARLVLGYLIGQEKNAAKLYAADSWPAMATAPAVTEPLLERRADVKAAQSRVQAAEAARQLARSLKTRDVTVGVSFEHNPTGTTWANNSYGVNVAIPLYWNYSYEGEIRRAEADLDVARESLEQVHALAIADVERARSDLDSAAGRVKRYDDELLKEAERAAKAAEFAFSHGAMGVMDLLDSRRTFKATQLEAAAARADYAKALAAWRAATTAENNEEQP